MSTLFEPVTLGKITLSNRLVMAPMSRNRATADGEATELMATYYAQRAGAGLIVSEGVQPSAVGQGFMNTPGLHSAAQVSSWMPVADAVHHAGGRIVAQLMHAGRIGHPSLYPSGHQSVAPSAIAAAGQCFGPDGPLDYPVPHALTADEIAATVRDFATAARNAVDAGFDGVEVHAGNGFLLHQFLSDRTNHRTDAYGGSLDRRVRFTREVADAVSDAIGADRVGLRISPGNPYNDMAESDTAELYDTLLAALPPLAYLHVMEAGDRPRTRAVRERWQGALILNPHRTPDAGPVTPETAAEVLEEGLADAVGLGALFLANPDLPERIRAGGPYNAVDESTFYGGDHRGYTDYPTAS
ncbi:alkene reductase [Streptomyces sp. TRM 70351]|uniref:alkene reductase n=1 Tax=Streptomyces sp. TRM 70351 TaxID=3116552 RepID=UPI002E7BC262|nr:alkene reductase [Streptomyces sp. TRM 70351]MEE1931496.1 alkene reductase [Streptomyces sp. TRM 70351]